MTSLSSGCRLDITPILNRELLIATRKTSLWGTRGYFAGLLLSIILATFGARYYWDQGQVSDHGMMASVAFQAFVWMLLAHMAILGLSGLAVDAYRHPRGPDLGCRDLPFRHHRPRRVGALPLARCPGQYRPSDRPAQQEVG